MLAWGSVNENTNLSGNEEEVSEPESEILAPETEGGVVDGNSNNSNNSNNDNSNTNHKKQAILSPFCSPMPKHWDGWRLSIKMIFYLLFVGRKS
jgi:hypothetical protein